MPLKRYKERTEQDMNDIIKKIKQTINHASLLNQKSKQ